MPSEKESELIKVAKNEYVLLLYRFVTGGCALLMTWFIVDIKSATTEIRKETVDIRKEFAEYKTTQEARISKLEGAQSVIDTSIRMHSRTLETQETTMQSLWSRMYEMNARMFGGSGSGNKQNP